MHEYLKPAEIAAMLRVNARTVKRWAQQGKLDGFQTPGGHWRITEESVWAMQRSGATERPADRTNS
jgi:excisionase family DNA binding protein